MLPIELICEIPSHKISIYEDVLTQHFHRLPHTCNCKTLFFRYWRNLLQQPGIDAVHSYTHYNATHKIREKRRSSLKWGVQVQPDLTVICHAHEWHHRLFSRIYEHLLHSYVVHMTHQYFSECRAVKYIRLVTKQRHEMCLLCIYRLSYTVNNTVLCILLPRSNEEWTCIYARCIGTISCHNGTDRTRGRKQVVKSSEPNVDAGKESKFAPQPEPSLLSFQVEGQT